MLNVDELLSLMQTRVTVLPKRLVDPAPSEFEKHQILLAASTAPDHRQILPWRFVEITHQSRARLASIFEDDLLTRDEACSNEQRERAREKAHRSPWLIAAICREADKEPHVNLHERYISLGCAIQSMLLMATGLGYSSSLTTGQALRSTLMSQFLKLDESEAVACFISFGQAGSMPKSKNRPQPSQYYSAI